MMHGSDASCLDCGCDLDHSRCHSESSQCTKGNNQSNAWVRNWETRKLTVSKASLTWFHQALIWVNRCFKKRFLVSCGVDPARQLWRTLLPIPLYYTHLKLPKNEALQRQRGRTEMYIHRQDSFCSNTVQKIRKQKVVGVSGTYISSQEWWKGDLPTWAVTWNGLNRKTKSDSTMLKMSPVKTPLRWLPPRTFHLSVSPVVLRPHSFTTISSFWLAFKFLNVRIKSLSHNTTSHVEVKSSVWFKGQTFIA